MPEVTRKLLVVEVEIRDKPDFNLYLHPADFHRNTVLKVHELPSTEELGHVAYGVGSVLGPIENQWRVMGQAILNALTKGKP